jgi:DNA-binding GntR family transcriptional regulator
MRLAELIEAQITGGALPAGTPLAPIGKLRLEYGHSRQTIGKAMRVLAGRNRIYRVPGLGYYAGGPPPELM